MATRQAVFASVWPPFKRSGKVGDAYHAVTRLVGRTEGFAVMKRRQPVVIQMALFEPLELLRGKGECVVDNQAGKSVP